MNRISNPFTPGAGFLPPELAGRGEVIESGLVLARRSRLLRAERGIMLIGPRGVGKTALLKYLSEDARKDGVQPIVVEVQVGGREIDELAAKLRDVLFTLDFTSKAKTKVREAFAILGNFVRRFSLNIGSFGVEVETTAGLGDSGNVEYDLSEVLLAAARVAKDSGTAIGLYIDELQNMSQDTLSGIVVALHHSAQELLPLYLVGSGLPTIRGLVGKSKTYAERMFNYEEIGPLDAQASSEAIGKPLRAAGVDISEDALAEAFAASKGYPFFLQEVGYQIWQNVECPPVERKDVLDLLPHVSQRLDRNFFDVRFDRISEGERRFLRAMADVRPDDEKPLAEVAERLGRPANALSMVRRSLIRKGMVYAPRLGTVAYTVPMFDDYIRRVMP